MPLRRGEVRGRPRAPERPYAHPRLDSRPGTRPGSVGRRRFMASTIKVTPQKEKIPEKVSETSPDRSVLDLSDSAVKELIRTAKKRGYVTHDQINALLASEEANSEQIENVLAM